MIQIPGVSIKEKFAEGGASHVYLGTYLKRGVPCAVKVLKDQLKQDSSQIKAFKNESKLLLAVRHPCIIEVWESGSTATDYYYIMEYFESKNLKNHIINKSAILADWVPIAVRTADALLYLHLNSMIHRDIKPENILVNQKGEVKMIDLSIAMKKTFMTSIFSRPPAVAAGTPSYMAPEQIRGKACDHRSDIYSLGATLYEMLVGRVPFLGHSQNEILDKHLNEKPYPPGKLVTEIPPEANDLIMKMLEKDPDDRIEDMNLVLYELKKIQRKGAPKLARIALAAGGPVTPGGPKVGPLTAARKAGSVEASMTPGKKVDDDEAARRSTRIMVQDGFLQFGLCQETDPPKLPEGYKSPLINLSRHGLGFVADAELPLEHCVDLALHLRGTRKPLYVRGKVAWCRKVKDANLRSIGIRITARSKDYMTAYEQLKTATKTGTDET
ncbi:MAG: protein kinase [Planctomycetes bacterium]|nr:protein kinase [Planctomycetota bacterium]